jgi:hypothetical protein
LCDVSVIIVCPALWQKVVVIVVEWFEEKSLRFFRDGCISVLGWHYRAVWLLSTKPCSVDENMASKLWEVLSGWGLTLSLSCLFTVFERCSGLSYKYVLYFTDKKNT